MDITITCSCGKKLDVPEELLGEKAKCPKCSSIIHIEKEANIPVLKIHKKQKTFTPQELFKHVVDSVVSISNDSSRGSGVFIDKKGIIATNRHVIGVARNMTVRLNDNSELKGKVLRSYKDTDLAFIKVPQKSMKTPLINKKRDVKVGESVYAIGHPHGLENTLTQGIISATSRFIKNREYIQTDTSINHGNSGGPLFNSYAEIIGINTLGMDGAEGLNFAIPIKTVLKKYAKMLPELEKIIKMMYCAYCGKNSNNNKYCDFCGSEMSIQKKEVADNGESKKKEKESVKTNSTGECEACEYKNEISDKYCSMCGAIL